METKLLQEIHKVLSGFPEYWDGDTLLKNKLIEEIRSYNETVIEALLSNELVKNTYSIKLTSGLLFKSEVFISMLRYKNYWDNSYTKYTNEVGLTSEGKYLKYNTDVVLDFPHKDAVLEGGMTKEDVGKREVYYHNVIAKEEIDTLFSSKILRNVKKLDERGEKDIDVFSEKENLILKGNNLIALHSLKERYAGKVKLIYIDPPYNTGGDSFRYNDRFNHSTWLTFMKNRLEAAKDLLAENGSIWINIDNNESHYLNVLLDSIFEKENFIADVIWNHTKQSKNDERFFSRHYNHLLVYAKNKETMKPFELPRTDEDNKNYRNPDNDPKGLWRAGDVRSPNLRQTLKFNIESPDGTIIHPPENGWRWSKESIEEKIKTKEIIFKPDNSGIIRKIYLSDQSGRTPENIWDSTDSGTTREANSELKALFGQSVFSTPKPEKLLRKIIQIASEENDIVLDFFLGTGTTAAVAMKMNRQFIGIEQMDYINSVSVPRLQKVIEGEQGGISEEVNWQGGGSFVYAELYRLNEEFLHGIQACQNSDELEPVIDHMKKAAYLNFKVDLEKVTAENENFQELSLEEQKDVLIQVLDLNQLYLNYSEIEDSQYDISDSVKAFNYSFYQKEGATNE
ncbi:site-specific DNA-methyltransferase [Bacillus piscicola]|uniref:site-specific DNA-methyltransferase n=1 Tax=Bacillus piscicola TaxID=1632684 RepID=UPI001F098158|nr:site-specific DNA-methyltransferase [Bacillus piscicola]